MHTNPFGIRFLVQRHKSIFIVCIGIILVFLIPVPVASVAKEEDPDDSRALLVNGNTPLTFTVPSLPSSTTKLMLSMGDSVRAPLSSKLEILIANNSPIHTTLGNIIGKERIITIPIHTTKDGSASVKISAPSLNESSALVLRTQQENKDMPAYTLYESKPLIQAILQRLYAQKAIADDIQYVYSEGTAVSLYKNPYARASTRQYDGTKYATYFPLSYLISAGIQRTGVRDFESWLNLVRPMILLSQLISGFLILFFLYNKNKLVLGIFAFFLVTLHRFSLYPARVAHIDFPAIVFLLTGLTLLSKKPKTAYILIGVSLAIKQMAIFIIPLILIWVWQTHKSKKHLAIACGLLSLVSIISLTPFVIDNPSGTLNSILFSVHRSSSGDFATPDISSMLSLEGLSARIAMLGMMTLIFIAYYKKEIALFGSCLAIFTIFVGFNPVLFFQYLAWIIPFIPLAMSEKD